MFPDEDVPLGEQWPELLDLVVVSAVGLGVVVACVKGARYRSALARVVRRVVDLVESRRRRSSVAPPEDLIW